MHEKYYTLSTYLVFRYQFSFEICEMHMPVQNVFIITICINIRRVIR